MIDIARRLRIPADWAPTLNPATLEARSRSRALAIELGLLSSPAALERYDRGDFAILAGLVFRTSDLEALTLLNDFLTYFFYIDDRVEEEQVHESSPLSLMAYLTCHAEAFQDGIARRLSDPGTRLMLAIRNRARKRMSSAWIERCGQSLRDYLLGGTLIGALHAGRQPPRSLAEYLEYRAYDSGGHCAQDLIELAATAELPMRVHDDEHFQALRRACTDVIAMSNDLYSYAKEMELGSPNNLLAVLMRTEGRSLADAAEQAVGLVNTRVQDYTRLRDSLPSYGRANDARIARFVAGQQAWMRGSHVWSLQTRRYRSPVTAASQEALMLC